MRKTYAAATALLALALVGISAPAWAHCDSLDGPVVTAAKKALASGDPSEALIWVRPDSEAEARAAFRETLGVRSLGPQARALADRAFFETLVRLHRAGEGAPYTGLKPAGTDFGPAVAAADKAVASGSQADLETLLRNDVHEGLAARFAELKSRQARDPKDLAAGRAYVENYVRYVHYVEGLHQAAEGAAAHHEAAEK